MTMVTLSHVGLRAGATTLVRDVSLEVAPGTWCTIIGPNGAGKTSLVSALAGLRTLSAGHVTIDGQRLDRLNDRARARLVAYVAQHPQIPLGMTVHEYVSLGRIAFHGVMRPPSAGDRAVVDGVLDRLELTQFRNREGTTLSGGERQRMVLARALAQSTKVLVLDEPISGLDVRHQMDLLELLKKEVAECGLTVIATLHDLTLASLFTDRLVLIDHGEVLLDGAARDVIQSDEMGRSYGVALRIVTIDGGDVVVPVRHANR